MRLIRVGWDALLVEVGDAEEATALYQRCRRVGVRARDIVPAARTVLFDGVEDLPALEARIRGLHLAETPAAHGPPVEVPTTYDGPDLAGVARLWKMTVPEAVALHTSTEFLVAFCGFAPGFAYCTGLGGDRAVPRLDSPRSRVPAGSVALAGEFTGVYPTDSPGGWRLIGTTSLVLWDQSREVPATLAPGAAVRFVDVT